MSRSFIFLVSERQLRQPFRQKPNLKFVNNGNNKIGIEEIRKAISWIQLSPYSGDLKEVIIHPAEKMTQEAQNALLKTLEEPPQKTNLYLLTTNLKRLLTTVTSRCEIIDLRDCLKKEIKTPLWWGEQQQTQDSDLKDNIFRKMLINPDPAEVFQFIEEETKKNDRETLLQQLADLTQALLKKRQEMPLDLYRNRLELLNKKMGALQKNANTRLCLENLYLEWKKTENQKNGN